MNKLFLAYQKRVIIATTLVNAHCQYNPAIREILTRYISHAGIVIELNLSVMKEWMHRNSLQLIDSAYGWYCMNVSVVYLGKSVTRHFDERYFINCKVGRSFAAN